MSADLRFVAHAAERDANELAPHRFGDRPSQRSLSDARRADKAQDRSLASRFQFDDGEIFENAFFDLVEIVVVPIENVLRLDADRCVPS